jgi:N-acetylneuraminic acid mutarotase
MQATGKRLHYASCIPVLVLAIALLCACGATPTQAAGQWVRRSSMAAARSWIGTATEDGKIYVIGGMVGSMGDRLDANARYDPQTDRWLTLAPLPTARSSPGTVAVDGQIFVIGGNTTQGTSTVVEAYDIAKNTWRTGLAPMPSKRFDLAAVAYGTTIYTFGGYDTGPLNLVEAYDTVHDQWRKISNTVMPIASYALQAVVVGSKIWVMGGRTLDGASDVIEVFDPQTYTWSQGGKLPEPMTGFGATLGGGKLHVAKFDKYYTLDMQSKRWTELKPMLTQRQGLQLTYIDGVLYGVGGCMQTGTGLVDVDRTEAYIDPAARETHPVEREGIGALLVVGIALLGAALFLRRIGVER